MTFNLSNFLALISSVILLHTSCIGALSFNKEEYGKCMNAPKVNNMFRYIPYYTKWGEEQCRWEMFSPEEAVISKSPNSRITKHTHRQTNTPVIFKTILMGEARFDAMRAEECLLANIEVDQAIEHRIAPVFYCTMTLALNTYLIMEYIEGNNLLSLKKSNLSAKYLLIVLESVGYFIDWLHSQNIIHHDIKSENILIDSNGQVKLVDFGFAGLTSEPFFPKLSPFYAAPEMISACYFLTKPATFENWESIDWYSLGITVFEICESDSFIPVEIAKVRKNVLIYLKRGIDPQFFIGRGDRADLYCGLLKFNPSERWKYAEIKAWITEHNSNIAITEDKNLEENNVA